MIKKTLLVFAVILLSSCSSQNPERNTTIPDMDEHVLWYAQPAEAWMEALPVGNGRLGAMVFGGVFTERLQLNEESVWTGKPADFVNPEAKEALPVVRKLLFDGKYAEAQKIAQEKMMGNKTVESTYQTLWDLNIRFDSLKG